MCIIYISLCNPLSEYNTVHMWQVHNDLRDGMLNMQGLILDLPRQMLGHYTPTSGGPLLSEVYEVTLWCDLCNPS